MAPDDRTRQTDEARQRLLEEIKRRAEEAELRRLEENERSPVEQPGRRRGEPPSRPSPPPPIPASSAPVASESDTRMQQARDDFSRQIDMRNADAAARILEECRTLNMDSSELTAMRLMLERLEEDLQQAPVAIPEEVPAEPEPVSPSELDPQEINNLIHQAEFIYQHERYAEARDVLDKVLNQDPNNGEAQTLRRSVERAIELSERIANEDARSRETLNSPPAAPSPTPAQPKAVPSDADVWGSSTKPLDTLGYDTMPGQEGPMSPPKPSVGSRLLPKIEGIARFLKPIALVILVALLAAGGYYLIRMLTSTVVPTQASILILPAVSTGGDPSLSQIADGFTDDVIRKLGVVSDLRVIAPISAYAAGSASWSPPQAARAVSAGLCLTWSFSMDSSSLHIQQSLFDSSSSIPTWSKTFDVPRSGLPLQRSEILGSMLAAVNVHASEEEQVALHKIPTTQAEAFASYLRGRSILRHPEVYPVANAILEFGRAVAIDSLFGEAYAALGWARIVASESGDTATANMGEAVTCVQRAVALGFRNAEAFRTWGAIERSDGHFAKSVERFDEATQIAPSDAEARRRLAVAQIIRGQMDQAIASARRALKDDPLNVNSYILLGLLQEYAAISNNDSKDDFATALLTLKAGERLATDESAYASSYLAGIHWYLQNPDDAIAILADYLARTRQNYESLYLLGRVQQASGRPKHEWQEILTRSKTALEDQLRGSPNDPVLLSWLCLVHTRLGEFKEALTSSKLALERGGQNKTVLYNTTRMYALQRNSKEAIGFLRRAIDREYDLNGLLDMDLFNLHGEPEYLKAAIR